MEGEHTPTIIQLIRSTDLAIIQLKDSHLYSSIPTREKEDKAGQSQFCEPTPRLVD